MIQFIASDALAAYRDLEYITTFVLDIKDNNAAEILSKKENKYIGKWLAIPRRVFQKLNLANCQEREWTLSLDLNSVGSNASEIHTQLTGLRYTYMQEMNKIKFAYIPPDKVKYFEEELLFDDEVYLHFASARDEIKSAGNCLAADLNTAAVFHLMRTVNIGLRALARHLKIKIIKGKNLEYCTDGEIIAEVQTTIDNKLEIVKAQNKSKKWEKENAFYRGLLLDLRFLKDVVRDPISHARKSYTEPGAVDVFIHVREFMNRLADGKIAEK